MQQSKNQLGYHNDQLSQCIKYEVRVGTLNKYLTNLFHKNQFKTKFALSFEIFKINSESPN